MTGDQLYFRLDDILGHVETHSRFEPCTCGRPYCGNCINWTVKVDRHGNRTKNPEWCGVKTQCDGIPPKRSLINRFWAWVGI